MTATLTRRAFGSSLFLGCAAASPASGIPSALAQAPVPAPGGKPVLVVSGKITRADASGEASFDRAALEALGQDGFETTTPWHDGRVRFDGVRMTRLLQAVGAAGEAVTAIALNDYATTIPVSDFERFGTILALKRDGAYMPVRDKGPLFIVYPYDSAAELRSRQYYSRSAWQVAKLVVA